MRTLAAIVLSLLTLSAWAQNDTDSLYQEFLETEDASRKFNRGYTLFWKWIYSQPQKAGKMAIELREVAQQTGRTAFVAQSYNARGIYYDVTSKRDSAIVMYHQALKIIEPHDSLHNLKGSYFNNVGLAYASQGSNDSAFYYYTQALQQAKAYDNLKFQGNIIHNIGIALKRQGRVKEAIGYYRKGISIGKQRKDKRYTAQLYHSAAEAFSALNIKDSALHFLRKAIPSFIDENDRFRLGMAYHNLGLYMRKSGYSDSSYIYLKEALKIRELLNDRGRASSSAYALANHYGTDDNTDSARKYIDIAATYIDTAHASRYSVFLSIKAWVEHLEGKHDESYQTMRLSQRMNDSSHARNFRSEVAAVQERLNLKVKEQEIENLEAQNALAEEKAMNQKTLLIATFVVLLLIIVMGLVMYNRTQLKHRAVLTEKELEFQEKANAMTIETQEEERQRIAQELHDDIGQQLTAIKMGWNNYLREHQQEEGALELQKNLNDLAEDVRTLSHRMMPKALVQLGLQAAMADLVNKQQHNGITAHFEYYNLKDRYDGRIEKTLYRIAQEALHNIVKHAKATEINVQLYGQEAFITMMIEDNGEGFVAEKTVGKGLFNMENRAKLMRGEVNIESRPGQGTVVFVKVPAAV